MKKYKRSSSRSYERERKRESSYDRRDKKRSKDRSRSREKERRREERPPEEVQQILKQKRKSRFTDAPIDTKTEQQVTALSSKLQENLYGSKEQVKNLSLLQKLNPANKNLGIGLTLVPTSGAIPVGLNTSVISLLTDASKIKRKIPLPKEGNFNYSGLLIGPRGNNQKQLEEKTGCKILVRGKGSQGSTPEMDDQQDLHVLILGDNQNQVARACAEIERIIFADEDTLTKIKQEQMKQYQQGIAGEEGTFDLSLTTPYGPPSENAFILEVPNECVGLVIGKEGETIKTIAKKSGALKVQVATTSAPNSKTRNVFVEGDAESVERVRKELNTIIETQRKMNSGSVSGSYKIDVEVPVRLIGLVIGRGGETIKGINHKTGAFVCLSKDEIVDKNKKMLTITGSQDLCLIAKYEIDQIVQNGLKNLQKQGSLTPIEMQMIKPITPITQQLAQRNLPIPTSVQTIKQDPTLPYYLNQTLQTQIPSAVLYQEFLGPTKSVIEECVVEEIIEPKKKRRFGQPS